MTQADPAPSESDAPALDPNVAQGRAADPAASVWVGASAGSGKTRVLSNRVLRLLLAGTPAQKILCITFTRAAAAEMANRINGVLANWATVPDAALGLKLAEVLRCAPAAEQLAAARRLFAQVIDCPGGLKILTVHAFCQSLLRRFPLESGLPPHFEVMEERDARDLLDEARRGILAEARRNPQNATARAVVGLTALLSQDDFAELLTAIAAERGRLQRILERHGGLAGTLEALAACLEVPLTLTPQQVLAEACRLAPEQEAALRAVVAWLAGGAKTDRQRASGLQAWLDADESGRIAHWSDYGSQVLTKEGTPRKTLATKALVSARPDLLALLEAETERLLAVEERKRAAHLVQASAAFLTLADAVLSAYAALKRARARLDFDDLVLQARGLLERPGVAPWVLYKLDGGLDHVLIDEAQDTNPDQWAVIAALVDEFFVGAGARAGRRTIFAVGDEKQSIFSFQRADPAEFARMRRYFGERVQAAGEAWQAVALEVSFRSAPPILHLVDAVFTDEDMRAGVVAEANQAVRHHPFRRHAAGHVELWPPVLPAEAPPQDPWAVAETPDPGASPAARLAAVIARTIAGWLAGGERLAARDRPIRPGDVLILVRRRSALVPLLVRALKDRGVPVAGADRMVLNDQLACRDLLALADFLLLPEDDLSLACVLKSPLIGLDEETLFDLAFERRGSLWRALTRAAGRAPADATGRLRAVRDWLAERLRQTDFETPYELFARVLAGPCPGDPVSGRRALLGRLGPEARDALDELLALALAFERTHPPSLQQFLAWLRAGETEVKREQDNQKDPADPGQVRIMTVHGAKGLEAPVVFLPDTMTVPQMSARIFWPDAERTVPLYVPRRSFETDAARAAREAAQQRQDEEYRRLLYVALTRAEDRLYICGYRGPQTESANCWYRRILAGAVGLAEPREFDFGPPETGGWQGPGLVMRFEPAVRSAAGAPAPAAGDGGGEDDGHGAEPAESAPPLPAWAVQPAPDEPDPPRPLTPSRPTEADPPLHSPLGADRGQRFRRGTLVHTLLQMLPDLAPAVRPGACRRFLERPLHGLSADEVAAIAREVLAILDDPALAALFGPGSRAEVPVVGRVGRTLVSGQVDRLVVGAETVQVIDYKTNRPPPRREQDVSAAYLRQMAVYRRLLTAIYPGRSCRCVLLWTDGPHAMTLSEAILDRHTPAGLEVDPDEAIPAGSGIGP